MTQVDSIIKTDRSQILRFNFLHYNIDALLREDVPRQDTLCVFYDPEGVNHILIENIKNHMTEFPMRTQLSFSTTVWHQMTSEDQSRIKYLVNPFLEKFLTQTELQKWSKLTLVTIDQIRCKCQANIYMDPQELITDILRVVAWNQLFRAKSANSFIYLSLLLQNIIQIINKKKLHKRFANTKTRDFQKLLSYELRYKINFESWPFIPDKFREYQQIDHYSPTPQKRAQFIEKRIHTLKTPVECPNDCVCFAEIQDSNNQFCKYTLKDGWVTSCPNRSNKIQCNHSDEEKMKKCRNAQIKKMERKKCKKNEDDKDENNQIEECIMWGLDLYTRNLIFHSLPQIDFCINKFNENKESKNEFIQDSLLKAINFNGNQGYDLKKACELIINYSHEAQKWQNKKDVNLTNENSQQKEQKTVTMEGAPQKYYNNQWQFLSIKQKLQDQFKQKEQVLFTKKDKFYADILLKKFQFCRKNIDKTSFRIHTKGKGARCIKKQGIKHGSFIVQYFGQLYEPWRWYEREDFIKQVMKKKKLKNFIPEFYNIYLQSHKDDPQGYDLMVVDPNKKGNFSSRFSHSCNPNCGTVTTISDGKYYIGMYSFRDIKYGQELTFDYCCMTESNYEHVHSICLCGTQKCRGNYLQLANSRTYSQLVDKNTCFFSRNSLILQALEKVTVEDLKLCSQFNIKQRMLGDAPQWIIKWATKLLKYIQSELQIYKAELIERWTKQYPWEQSTPQIQAANIQLYAETSKNDLFFIRFQNLFTTVDKLKYFLNTIKSVEPPLYYLPSEEVFGYMVFRKDSILKQIQEVMIQFQKQKQAYLIKKFMETINLVDQIPTKLFYFRLCCLCISHMCFKIKQTSKFNSLLLGDIVYFYSFTHTYFTANEYKGHVSQQIRVSLSQITGKLNDAKNVEKIQKKYSSQFVWGQLVSWYKQTIVNPQASLSQDRRGTLSYPMIKSTINSVYPFEKNCRKYFLKALREKSSSCWPSAPDKGCLLSFKNPFKCYGTVFFQNVHNAQKFKDFPYGNLLQNVLNTINCNFNEKLKLFKMVEAKLSGIGEFHQAYNILDHIEAKYFSFNEELNLMQTQEIIQSKPTKKGKMDKSLSCHSDS